MQTTYCEVVHRAHRFYRNGRFYETIHISHPKMDLSIRGHRLFKDVSPINVPTGEDGAGITCDGEKKWLPVHTRRAHGITYIRQCFLFCEAHHRILADLEIAT